MHATHLTRGRHRARSEASHVCFCPTTERDLGDGIGPAAALVAGRRAACAWARTPTPSSTCSRRRGPSSWTSGWPRSRAATSRPEELLVAATEGGARSLGWPDAGRIAPGALGRPGGDRHRRASAWPAPAPDHLVEAAVFAAGAADVRDVMVGGRWVVRDRCSTSGSRWPAGRWTTSIAEVWSA